MATSILNQLYPAAGVLTDLYTVPIGKTATLIGIIICNQAASDTTFKLAIAPTGGADNPKHYWFKNVDILLNETISVDALGIQLEVGAIVRVESASGLVSFNINGIVYDN